jgi:hypothetical protein
MQAMADTMKSMDKHMQTLTENFKIHIAEHILSEKLNKK